jgi:hypothetical protein
MDISKDYIPLADRRQDGVKYIDLDDQKVSDPNPPARVYQRYAFRKRKIAILTISATRV